MTQYIPKAALVAEIDRRILEDYNSDDVEMDEVARAVLASLKFYIGTLEVKEVDLEDDVDKILKANDWNFDKIDFYQFAKYFFELGLKMKGE